jgi:hypothetical protein
MDPIIPAVFLRVCGVGRILLPLDTRDAHRAQCTCREAPRNKSRISANRHDCLVPSFFFPLALSHLTDIQIRAILVVHDGHVLDALCAHQYKPDDDRAL